MGDFEAPVVNVVTFQNLDLPGTSKDGPHEGVEAVLLDGYTYPLYKQLRNIKFDFVRGVHNKAGMDRWVKVVPDGETAEEVTREVADAADWLESDEEEEP